MVAGYNLRVEENIREFKDYIEKGACHLESQKSIACDRLKKYINNGIADGTKIEKDWFPEIEADIFISHSRMDEDLAKGLAGWLNDSFGLKCFIDSCVWGYADDLLKQINDKFSDRVDKPTGEYIYNHIKCNTASKHVNMMLSIALQKMIDKAEITILLNTQNAISCYEDVYEDAAYSPWIYSEIVCTELVRKKPILEYRDINVCKEQYFEHSEDRNDGYSAAYRVTLDHLKNISIDDLHNWKALYNKEEIPYPIDYLYKLTHKKEAACILTNTLYS